MKILEANPYRNCDFGDKRLTNRAVLIAEVLKVKYGEPLSQIFQSASDLKRGYEFFSNPKTTFNKLTQPSFTGLTQLAQAMVREAHRAPKKLHKRHSNIWTF